MGTPGTMEDGVKRGYKQRDLHPQTVGPPTYFHSPTSKTPKSGSHERAKDYSLGKLKGSRKRPPKDDIWESSDTRTGLQLSNSVVTEAHHLASATYTHTASQQRFSVVGN